MSDAHHALSTTSRVRPRPHYILGLLLPAATTLVVTLRPATVAGFQQASSSRVRCNHYLTHGLSATSAVRLSRESATSASLSYVMGTIKMMSLNSFQQQPCLDDGNGSNGELGMEGSSRDPRRLESRSRESSSPDEDDNPVSPVSIKVVGVGGGGGNAVDGMISTATRTLPGVEFLAMNTDTQALTKSLAEVKIALGSEVTRGLGAGGKPEVGKAAAIESSKEIEKALVGADMVFVTAGMGGGTGTGAAPVIASVARGLGCVTVAIVTEPFRFEGWQRCRQAVEGLRELRSCTDTVLVVANDRLMEIVPGQMTMTNAFLVADDVLRQGVIGTSEIIVRPGLMNVDFADVREIVKNSGTGLIGIGTATGKTRAEDAAVGAMCSPLLDYPISSARGVIFNIVGGPSLSLTEVNVAARIIHNNVHPDANIIVGALVDERCGSQVSVTVLATGFPDQEVHPDVNSPAEAADVSIHSTMPKLSQPECMDNGGRIFGFRRKTSRSMPVETSYGDGVDAGAPPSSMSSSQPRWKWGIFRRLLGLQ